ncbi:hypothetical protein HRR78_008716 [Exophiala dermatitidis]|nr:hypothetical protein HRR75_005212 [Exophiala dermatitidis]KAJ4535899.1 hypothetical protein HRR78_008716 [Exophiala dermatitidis]
MAGFTEFISVLSLLVMYVQQKAFDSILAIPSQMASFFHNTANIFTLSGTVRPRLAVTEYVTETIKSTMTVIAAAPWSTVTSAATVVVNTTKALPTYTVTVSGFTEKGLDVITYQSPRNPWQLWQVLLLVFVMFLVPVIFVVSYVLNELSLHAGEEVWRFLGYYQGRFQRGFIPYLISTLHRDLHVFLWHCSKKVKSALKLIQSGVLAVWYFFDTLHRAVHVSVDTLHRAVHVFFNTLHHALDVFLWHCSKKVELTLELLRSAASAAWDKVLEMLCALRGQFIKAVPIISMMMVTILLWLCDKFIRLTYQACLVAFRICEIVWLWIKEALLAPIKEKAFEPLNASIRQRVNRFKEMVGAMPLIQKLVGHADIAPAAPNEGPVTTPQRPNRFQVPYSPDSPQDNTIQIDRAEYEALLLASKRVAQLENEVRSEQQKVVEAREDTIKIIQDESDYCTMKMAEADRARKEREKAEQMLETREAEHAKALEIAHGETEKAKDECRTRGQIMQERLEEIGKISLDKQAVQEELDAVKAELGMVKTERDAARAEALVLTQELAALQGELDRVNSVPVAQAQAPAGQPAPGPQTEQQWGQQEPPLEARVSVPMGQQATPLFPAVVPEAPSRPEDHQHPDGGMLVDSVGQQATPVQSPVQMAVWQPAPVPIQQQAPVLTEGPMDFEQDEEVPPAVAEAETGPSPVPWQGVVVPGQCLPGLSVPYEGRQVGSGPSESDAPLPVTLTAYGTPWHDDNVVNGVGDLLISYPEPEQDMPMDQLASIPLSAEPAAAIPADPALDDDSTMEEAAQEDGPVATVVNDVASQEAAQDAPQEEVVPAPPAQPECAVVVGVANDPEMQEAAAAQDVPQEEAGQGEGSESDTISDIVDFNAVFQDPGQETPAPAQEQEGQGAGQPASPRRPESATSDLTDLGNPATLSPVFGNQSPRFGALPEGATGSPTGPTPGSGEMSPLTPPPASPMGEQPEGASDGEESEGSEYELPGTPPPPSQYELGRENSPVRTWAAINRPAATPTTSQVSNGGPGSAVFVPPVNEQGVVVSPEFVPTMAPPTTSQPPALTSTPVSQSIFQAMMNAVISTPGSESDTASDAGEEAQQGEGERLLWTTATTTTERFRVAAQATHWQTTVKGRAKSS